VTFKFYWSVLYFLLSNPALTPLLKRPFQLAKMPKKAISTLIFSKFSGGIAPRPHAGEGLQRPSLDPTPSTLRRFAPLGLGRDFRSLHRRPQIFPGACLAHPKILAWRPYGHTLPFVYPIYCHSTFKSVGPPLQLHCAVIRARSQKKVHRTRTGFFIWHRSYRPTAAACYSLYGVI